MGWAEGLNAGINLGNVIKQGMLQQDLADEAKKYKVTEGAYGSGLNENLQQVIGARDQALQGLGEGATPEQIQQVHEQYTPAMAELSRRVGLSGPDYSVASGGYDGGKNFASMKEAQTAAAPLRTQGLSDVYRSYGQIDKAEELNTRAQQQQLTGLQLNKAMREEDTAVGTKAATDALAELKAAGTPITSQTLAELAKTHKGDYQSLLQGELSQLGYDEKSSALEIKTLKRDLSKAAIGGIPTINKFLADKFDPNKEDNITPEIVQTKAGFTVMYGDKVLSEYGTHKSLNELVGTVHGQIDGDPLGTMKTLASIRASEAQASLVPYQQNLYAAQAAAWGSKPETAATAAENKQFTELTKTTAWQAAERKGDTAAMNSLMIGRGLNPSKHGGGEGAPGWGGGNKPTAKPEGVKTTPAAETKPSKPTEAKPTEKELNARVDYNSYQEKARAAREKGLQDRAARQEQEALAAQQADELAARRRAQIAADFRSKYGG